MNAANIEPKSLASVFDAISQLFKYEDKNKTDEKWRSHCFSEELNGQIPCLKYWDIVLKKKKKMLQTSLAIQI